MFVPGIIFNEKYISGKVNRIGKGVNIESADAPFVMPINNESNGKKRAKISKLRTS
tara:strand:- start:793 stop:960 length:168 start_codon:yes stop_codon:yes gene_type:complete